MEFSVFQRQQNHLTEAPKHPGQTRTIALLAVVAGLAERIGTNAIKLTTEAEWKEVKRCSRNYTPALAHALRVRADRIPEPCGRLETFLEGKRIKVSGFGLPPREVAGCWYQPPQSDSWKLAHRQVVLPQPNRGLEGLASAIWAQSLYPRYTQAPQNSNE
jgi:hypothetical protein